MKQNNQKRTIPLTDIFERWGIDIVGPLPITREGNRYIVVAMDYFSRWPEAKLLKAANAETVATFIYEKIICRFRAPRIIQSDRGTHFVNEVIRKLTKRFRVRHSLSSPYHPQSNGLVERFNKTLCEGIAKSDYHLSIDEKQLNATINGNLLKPYHDRSTWELIVIVESQKV